MLILFIVADLCLSQIYEIDLENNGIWTEQMSYCENCSFKVSQKDNTFIYASVILSESNDNLFLVANSSIVSDLNGQIQQGQSIDILRYIPYIDQSMMEGKKTRFLKIPTTVQPIYISIIDSTANSVADVTFQASSSILCEQNCSNNGLCTADIGCVCNEGFVGNICEIQAVKIEEGEQNIKNNGMCQFLYIYLQNFLGQKLYFEFSVIFDFIMKSNSENTFSLQDYFYSAFYVQNSLKDLKYGGLCYFSNEESCIFSIEVSDGEYLNETYNHRYPVYVLSAVSYEKIDLNVKFLLVTDDNLLIIILATTIPISVIIILISLFFLRKHLQHKRLFQQRREISYQEPVIQQKRSSKTSIQKINQKLSSETQESCSICLEMLKNGKNISYTVCSHQFHQECIEAWSKKHSICPLCRTNLVMKGI